MFFVGDSQVQKIFLAPSADKQTCNYGTECSNYYLPPLNHHKGLGLSRSKIKW